MRNIALAVVIGLLIMLDGAAQAQAPAGGRVQAAAPAPMSFFVTSVGSGKGGNMGGIKGADAHCQTLASTAGAGDRTWHAYLSVTNLNGKGAINARDRMARDPGTTRRASALPATSTTCTPTTPTSRLSLR